MKVVKLLAGGLVVAITYNVGKLVGGIKTVKSLVDAAEESFPGIKKAVAKTASERLIDRVFDKPEVEEKESQQ